MYPNDSEKHAYAMKILQRKARDHARTPVQWDDSAHAGFTSTEAKPWMRVNDDFKEVNVAAQINGPRASESVHAFWKRSLELRKKEKEVYVYGDFELLDHEEDPHKLEVLAYRRWSKDRNVVVILNFSGKSLQWKLVDGMKVNKWSVGNYDEKDLHGKATSGLVELKPWEALVGEIE